MICPILCFSSRDITVDTFFTRDSDRIIVELIARFKIYIVALAVPSWVGKQDVEDHAIHYKHLWRKNSRALKHCGSEYRAHD